ncbi:hypothetical protein EYC98_18685 [Halieaceae bacterium IMCC14734]|uniref:Dockerin domain-containing protein n=1 Tax=Candidatus Litorirhabdus singularis TaxID=2518993 RepID=A0ABT3TKS8_9GAMM|nr:hypothetical protein [Candidatus Litorirhabdus singularis]MCX2982893.1 hypothetical protein [Candidatus Litorirhabdus singularis]
MTCHSDLVSYNFTATKLAWLLLALVWMFYPTVARAQTMLVNDGVVLGSISAPNDSDEFAFEATAGEAAHISVTRTSGSLDPKIWLYRPDGTLLRTSGSNNATVSLDCYASSGNCQLNQTGTYRLVVEDYFGTQTGGYDIQLTQVSSSNENGSLIDDGVVGGDITVGDLDTFVFDAVAGEALHIRVVKTSGNLDPEVWLYNPDGTLYDYKSDSTTVEFDCRTGSSTCALAETGTYRLVVSDYYDTQVGTYEIQIVRVLSTNQNGTLVNDDAVSGDLTVGDIDTFLFEATAGEAAHISVTRTSGSLDPKIWLYRPDGTLLRTSGSNNATVSLDCYASSGNCQLNQTGTYRLVVEDYFGTQTGGYDISFSGSDQFSLSADTPFWDSRFPAGPAVQLRWRLSSQATDYEVYRDGVKIYPTSGVFTDRSFRNEIGLTPGQTYSYYIKANNSNGPNKTNTILVGPMPDTPATPTVDSVDQIEILQGNSHQDVTITGSNFTSSTWHQFSTDNGSTWTPAQSLPLVNSATSLTAAINNTILRTVFIRVCASFASNACSEGIAVSIVDPGTDIAPAVDHAFPVVIAQGSNGYRKVKVTGSGFESANSVQQSTNGEDWFWLPATPVIHSPNLLDIDVDTSVVGKGRIRVCVNQGSYSCSAGTAFSIETEPTDTPMVSSIPTHSIRKGSEYFTLTIEGDQFTPVSFPQYSLDYGVSWNWVEHNPMTRPPASITATAPYTNAGSLMYRVCAYYGSQDCSSSLTLINEAALQPTEFDYTCTASSGCNSNSTKALIIAHGWNSAGNVWARETAYDACKRIGLKSTPPSQPVYHSWPGCSSPDWNNQCDVPVDEFTPVCTVAVNGKNWDVWVVDWSTTAARWDPALAEFVLNPTGGALEALTLPPEAWWKASAIGRELGKDLKNRNYDHVHFVAHSAGAMLIDAATARAKKDLGSSISIHETFLDAYDARKHLAVGHGNNFSRHISSYGKEADWVDSYVDIRAIFPAWAPNAGADTTDLHLTYGYNIDVTPTTGDDCVNDPAPWSSFTCPHSRPYRFYRKSIDNSITGASNGYDSFPDDFKPTLGFPLSLADGGNPDYLANRKNQECRMQEDGTCVDVPWTTTWEKIGDATTTAASNVAKQVVKTATGTTQVIKNSLNRVTGASMGTLSALIDSRSMERALASVSSTSEQVPASFALELTTENPVNYLLFDWAFLENEEGLFSMFIDDELVFRIDQRNSLMASTSTEEVYIGGDSGYLEPGTHTLSFRLSGYGANSSNVDITNISLELIQPIDAGSIAAFPFAGDNGTVSPSDPQVISPGQSLSLNVAANSGYETSPTVGGSCPEGSWNGNTWITGLINSSCSVSFSFSPLDTDSDDIPNVDDIDDDDDGITDIDEDNFYGTNPLLYDTDSDGFSDKEEILAGSNPLDGASDPLNVASGDINQDGEVDTKDLLLAQRILLGQYSPTQQEQDRWDVAPLVNGVPEPDHENNLGDYLILQQKVLGIINF